MTAVVDGVAALLILGMTYALMSEGLWGAALQFFNALFAALIMLNCYEPLAEVIGTNINFLSGYADALSILLIFTASLLVIRLITENIAPAMIRFPMPVYQIGRIAFGLGGALVTMGVLLLALDASPVDKKILGVMDYKHMPFYKVRLDKELLAFFQYETGMIFKRSGPPDKEYGNTRVFDPKADWLLRAQEARPYGKEGILEDESKPAAEGTTGGESSGGAQTKGAGPGSAGGPMPAGPGGPARPGRPGGPGR